jgi:hypothetical protein
MRGTSRDPAVGPSGEDRPCGGSRANPVPAAFPLDIWRLGAQREGLPIIAPAGSRVFSVTCGTVSTLRDGHLVISEPDGLSIEYRDLAVTSRLAVGTSVDAGTALGRLVPASPRSPGPRVVIAVRDADGREINPFGLLVGSVEPHDLAGSRSGIGEDPETMAMTREPRRL